MTTVPVRTARMSDRPSYRVFSARWVFICRDVTPVTVAIASYIEDFRLYILFSISSSNTIQVNARVNATQIQFLPKRVRIFYACK